MKDDGRTLPLVNFSIATAARKVGHWLPLLHRQTAVRSTPMASATTWSVRRCLRIYSCNVMVGIPCASDTGIVNQKNREASYFSS